MTFQTMNLGASFFASSQKILKERGITVEIGSDFEQYRALLEDGRPTQTIAAPFNPELHALDDKNAFWVVSRNADGVLIQTQAAKRVQLRGASFAEHMRQAFVEYPPALPDIDFKRSRFRASPGAYQIKGEVVYHGDFWLNPDDSSVRGSGLSTILARYGLMLAMSRWDPDYIFGFLASKVAFKGFGERMGYMHTEPGVLRWFREGQDQAMEGFLCYLTNAEIRYLFEMPIREHAELAKAA